MKLNEKVKIFIKDYILEFIDLLTLFLLVYAILGIVTIAKYNIYLFYFGLFILIYFIIRFVLFSRKG